MAAKKATHVAKKCAPGSWARCCGRIPQPRQNQAIRDAFGDARRLSLLQEAGEAQFAIYMLQPAMTAKVARTTSGTYITGGDS